MTFIGHRQTILDTDRQVHKQTDKQSIKYINIQTRLRQLVLKPGFRPKGRALGMYWKSQKISTASGQYFLSYVKKTTGGGGEIDPPPAGIGETSFLF